MLLERSGGVVAQLLPHHEQGGQLPRLAVGQFLRLMVDTASADGVLVRLGDGRLLRLLGLDGAQGPGDVLLLRVLTLVPRLELALLKSSAASVSSQSALVSASLLAEPDEEPAAMRPNQAMLQQQVATSTQDAATLALSWRAMVLAQLRQQLLLRTLADGQHVPGSLFGSDAGAALLREVPREMLSLRPGLDQSWMFAAYVWAGRRVLLSLLASEEEPVRPPLRRRGSIALRLELMLPGLGMVKLQLRLMAGGIALDLAAEQEPVRVFLRRALRPIVAAVARAELRVVRCRLARTLPAAGGALDLALAGNAASGLMFSPALFQAAAELALLLSNPLSNPLQNRLRPASADRADDADFALLGDLVVR